MVLACKSAEPPSCPPPRAKSIDASTVAHPQRRETSIECSWHGASVQHRCAIESGGALGFGFQTPHPRAACHPLQCHPASTKLWTSWPAPCITTLHPRGSSHSERTRDQNHLRICSRSQAQPLRRDARNKRIAVQNQCTVLWCQLHMCVCVCVCVLVLVCRGRLCMCMMCMRVCGGRQGGAHHGGTAVWVRGLRACMGSMAILSLAARPPGDPDLLEDPEFTTQPTICYAIRCWVPPPTHPHTRARAFGVLCKQRVYTWSIAVRAVFTSCSANCSASQDQALPHPHPHTPTPTRTVVHLANLLLGLGLWFKDTDHTLIEGPLPGAQEPAGHQGHHPREAMDRARAPKVQSAVMTFDKGTAHRESRG